MTTCHVETFKVQVASGRKMNAQQIATALERIANYVRQGIALNSEETLRDPNGESVATFVWTRYDRVLTPQDDNGERKWTIGKNGRNRAP